MTNTTKALTAGSERREAYPLAPQGVGSNPFSADELTIIALAMDVYEWSLGTALDFVALTTTDRS